MKAVERSNLQPFLQHHLSRSPIACFRGSELAVTTNLWLHFNHGLRA